MECHWELRFFPYIIPFITAPQLSGQSWLQVSDNQLTLAYAKVELFGLMELKGEPSSCLESQEEFQETALEQAPETSSIMSHFLLLSLPVDHVSSYYREAYTI